MKSWLLPVVACSSIDIVGIVDILKKPRKQVDDCICQLDAKRAERAERTEKTEKAEALFHFYSY
jgi:putative redox protein